MPPQPSAIYRNWLHPLETPYNKRFAGFKIKIHDSSYLSIMSELSMGDALKLFLQKSRLKGNMQAMQITDIWEQLMGKTIARYTDKIQIINHTLFIDTSVAPLKNELLFQKEKIIQRVNEALGERLITEIVIR